MREYYHRYLPKEVYRRTLSVARSYYDDLKAIKDIEDKYIFPGQKGDYVHARSGHGDPTANAASQIIKHTQMLRKRTDAVKKILENFTVQEQAVIISNVMKKQPLHQSEYFSERTAQKLRHDFLVNLAIELGEILK